MVVIGGDLGANMADKRAALEELRTARASLKPRPSLEELAQAQEAVSNVDTQLIEDLEKLMLTTRPDTLDPMQFASLQALRESRLCRNAEARTRAPLAVLHLDEQYRHYDGLVMGAERALFLTPQADGASASLPSDDAVADAVPVAEQEWEDKKPVVATLCTPMHGSVAEGPALALPSMVSQSPGPLETGAPGGHGDGVSSSEQQGSPASAKEVSPLDSPTEDLLARLLAEALACAAPSLDLTPLCRGHPLDALPDVLDRLPALTHLHVAEHRLTTFPDSLGSLPVLRSLNASFNRLATLPPTLGGLTALTHLDLRSNRLEELPPELGRCTALRYLNVASNRLAALPEAIGGLTQLETLLGSLNHLRGLPTAIGGCTALTHLDVHFNEIKEVPAALGHCGQLRRLDLGNNFAELRTLPATLGDLRQLEELTLSHNSLRALPDSLARLPHLRHLHLEACPLRYPPKEIVAQGTPAVLAFLSDQSAAREAEAAAAKRRGPLSRLLLKMRGRKPKQMARDASYDDLKRLA